MKNWINWTQIKTNKSQKCNEKIIIARTLVTVHTHTHTHGGVYLQTKRYPLKLLCNIMYMRLPGNLNIIIFKEKKYGNKRKFKTK